MSAHVWLASNLTCVKIVLDWMMWSMMGEGVDAVKLAALRQHLSIHSKSIGSEWSSSQVTILSLKDMTNLTWEINITNKCST